MITNLGRRLAVGIILGVVGCSAPSPEGSLDLEDGDLYGRPNGPSGTYWNSAEGQPATVPVCWTANAVQGRGTDGVLLGSPFPGFANAKAWTREWAENTWGRVARITFTGWDDTCAVSGSGDDNDRNVNGGKIMFSFLTQASTPPGFGTWYTDINGKSPTFGTMIRMNRNSSTKSSYEYPVIHELGHALGFAHEQVRPDNWVGGNPTVCTGLAAGEGVEPGGSNLTSFVDAQSVMCYGGGPRLSPGDVMGAQKRYGRQHTGSLVGFHGMCANIQGGSTANGAAIVAWPCTGSWNDTFFRPNDSLEQLKTPSNSRCLNVQGGTVPNPLIGWDCGDFSNERFAFGNTINVGAELRGLGNLCAQMVGNQMQVQVCSGASSQRWDLQHATGSIRYDQIRYIGGTNMCLTAQTTNGAIGEELRTATCSSTDTKQRFTYPGQGIIKYANNSSLCLNVFGGLPTPGSVIGLWTGCDAAPHYQNTQFHLFGRVRVLNSCLQVQNQAAPGDIIKAQTCNALDNQVWDYYF